MRRPRYEIEGLISFYPHFRTTPAGQGGAARLPRPVLLAARRRGPAGRAAGPLRRGRRRRAGRGVLPRPLRHRPGRRGQRAPGRGVRCGRSGRRPPGSPLLDEAVAASRAEPWPNDPYPAGSGVAERYASLRALLAGCARPGRGRRHAQGLQPARHGRRRLPDRARSGAWSAAPSPGSVKYAICNADESEPGTFKDRQILADQPHLVLEGLLLGMAVVGAEQGWVFIRHEYGPEEAVLRAEIEALRDGRRDRPGRLRQRPAGSTSRSSSRPAATSSARRPRCWSAWRATAASRATSRRSPATTACTAGRR